MLSADRLSYYLSKVIVFLFVFIVFILINPLIPVQASASGTWSYTGSLLVPRYNADAVTLQDGKVLTVGGSTSGNVNDNESEVYDPTASSWTFAGTMVYKHSDPTSVLLQDGTVLVASGFDRSQTETYDPSTGTWTTTGPWASGGGHVDATETLLTNGKVLLAGGVDTSATDLYDPTTRTYTFSGSMTADRAGHIAVLLQNGKVLIAGGNGCTCGDSRGPETFASAEIYDPSTGSFTLTGSMNVPRSAAGSVLLPDGRVLVAGGSLNLARYSGSMDPSTTAEIYDPTTGVWSMTGNLHSGRSAFGPLQLLPDGDVLAAGGDSAGTSEEYNSTTGAWETPTNLQQPQCNTTSSKLQDGRILLIAGTDCASSNMLAITEIYTQNTAPVVNQLTGASISEGDTYMENGSFTDPDSAFWSATVDYGDGSGTQPLSLDGMNFSLNHTYATANTYTVTVAVTDNQGAIGTGSATVIVHPVTTFNPVADTFVEREHPDNNYGSNNNVKVDSNPKDIGLLKFNTDSLVGKTVLGAKLRLYVSDIGTVPVSLKDAGESWSETGVTWNNRPNIGNVITTVPVGTLNSYVEVDITSYIAQHIGEKIAFALTTDDSNNFKFASKETSNQPQLVITYQ